MTVTESLFRCELSLLGQTLRVLIWGWTHNNRFAQVCHIFLTPALQLTQREQNMWWVNINLSNRFTTIPRCPREASNHLGNHSLAAYRLPRFTDSTEACEAERLQAGLRVYIKMMSRWGRGTRVLGGEGECIFMQCYQNQEVETAEAHWRGWEPTWWQSSGAKRVSRWRSRWWKMKCKQPSETNRQAEHWAQSCQCQTLSLHTHTHKFIHTLTHLSFFLCLLFFHFHTGKLKVQLIVNMLLHQNQRQAY